jgi:predicted DNA-binding transcriptional regulator AlpA
MEPQEKLLPTRDLIARYSVVDRTIDRWIEAGILPQPIRINNRRYWRQSELEQCERNRMVARSLEQRATESETAA